MAVSFHFVSFHEYNNTHFPKNGSTFLRIKNFLNIVFEKQFLKQFI